MRFAHVKTHHRFERMRLRGLSGARDEFHLAAIVQNLKTSFARDAFVHLNAIVCFVAVVSERPDPPERTVGRVMAN